MELPKKLVIILFAVFLFIPFKGFNQHTEVKDTSHYKLINAAREIIQAANTCALITVDEEGSCRVRTMDPFPPEKNFTVWLGTNANSRKV